MTNQGPKVEMADRLLDGFQQQMSMMSRIQQERAQIIGVASVRDGRVTVVVNAEGIIRETKFGAGIEDLSFAEVAEAVTMAAQQAAADAERKGQELTAPLLSERRAYDGTVAR